MIPGLPLSAESKRPVPLAEVDDIDFEWEKVAKDDAEGAGQPARMRASGGSDDSKSGAAGVGAKSSGAKGSAAKSSAAKAARGASEEEAGGALRAAESATAKAASMRHADKLGAAAAAELMRLTRLPVVSEVVSMMASGDDGIDGIGAEARAEMARLKEEMRPLMRKISVHVACMWGLKQGYSRESRTVVHRAPCMLLSYRPPPFHTVIQSYCILRLDFPHTEPPAAAHHTVLCPHTPHGPERVAGESRRRVARSVQSVQSVH
jgi:hypothetical protein